MPELGVSQALRRAPFPESLSLLRAERPSSSSLLTSSIFLLHFLHFFAHFLHAQVLSPGDVAFTLGAGNDSYIVSNSAEWDPNNICMSLTSLIGGLVMLLGQYFSYTHSEKMSIRKCFFAMLTNE